MVSARVLPLYFDSLPPALGECLEAIARPEVTFRHLDPSLLSPPLPGPDRGRFPEHSCAEVAM